MPVERVRWVCPDEGGRGCIRRGVAVIGAGGGGCVADETRGPTVKEEEYVGNSP